MTDLASLELDEHGDDVVARLSGELDLSNAPEFGERLRAAAPPAGRLVADLTAVTYFDSAGVRLLDDLCARGRVHVVAPEGSRARTALRICAFPPELLFEDVAAALS